MLYLAGYPGGTRIIVRRERPHPGARLSLFDHDEGMRHQVLLTEAQLRNLFGERGRHPHADLIEAEQLVAGKSPKAVRKAGALGRRVKATGVDFVFRPQLTIYLLWALGDEETRRVIEAAHERAIERVLEWIEDEVAVIRFGKDGVYQVRPPGGLVAACFRHYEGRSGMPLLHDHLMLSVKGQRLDGKWGSVHSRSCSRTRWTRPRSTTRS
ncbi:MobF family relaxase [Streptomyces flavidovirens]